MKMANKDHWACLFQNNYAYIMINKGNSYKIYENNIYE